MALTGTNRGTGGNATGATTIAIVPGTNFAAGTLAILCIAYDNSGNQGADPYSSITDNAGNTWTPRINRLNDPGAANAGSALRIFTSNIGTLTTANTITITFGSSTTAKAWTLTEVSAAAGFFPSYLTGASAGGNGTTQTITSGTITVNDLILGALGQEGNGTRTGDADTTNGTWSTAQSTGFGTTTGGQEIITQFKVQTTTNSTQTFNPTATPLGDWNIAWISVTEVLASFDPMGMMGFFGI